MDNKTAKANFTAIGVGNIAHLDGYFDFPTNTTRRDEKIISIGDTSAVLYRTGAGTEEISYSKINYMNTKAD